MGARLEDRQLYDNSIILGNDTDTATAVREVNEGGGVNSAMLSSLFSHLKNVKTFPFVTLPLHSRHCNHKPAQQHPPPLICWLRLELSLAAHSSNLVCGQNKDEIHDQAEPSSQ